ncbi:MAG: hypothetical protein WBZ36_21055 [Candidatus Nitrosopolaris sp.]
MQPIPVYSGGPLYVLYTTMKKMQRWLRNYDRLRLDPDTPNESWVSSKYDIEGMHWTELQQIYLPELAMCWGPACSALRKSWYAYKMAGRQGGYRADIAFRINRIQAAMGIPKIEFHELDPRWVDEQLTEEEIQLRREEEEEDDW